MSSSKSVSDGDLIVAHATFVRALARELVFDADLAKDVAQDVLLAALENSPRDSGSIKGWLASIVRNVAAKAFRTRSRRAQRESCSAIVPVPTPEEILAREDTRRSLIEHVIALDESVRAVMILRFYEDLQPREIAQRLGIPVETVRTRIKRGVALLRARLERAPDGGKGAWCLALVTELKIQPPQVIAAGIKILRANLLGAIVMGALKKVAVVAVLLALGWTAWFAIERVERSTASEKQVASAPSPGGVIAVPAEDVGAMPAAGTRSPIASTPASESTNAAPTTGSVSLAVHWFDGTPAAGINVSINPQWNDRSFDDFTVVTDEEGKGLIGPLPAGRQNITLDRGPAGGCDVVAGECATVEITIPRGFDIAGRVIERGGRTIAGAEILLASSTGGVVARSDASGRFKIRSAGEGVNWVCARAALHAPSAQRELIGVSTAFENVELVLDPAGSALEGVIYAADGQPLARAQILVGDEARFDQVNFDDGGRGRTPPAQRLTSDERGRFVFAGIPVGKSPVQARAHGHAPWSGEVEAIDGRAAHLEIRLARSATLSGRVTDTAGAPVAGALIQANGEFKFASHYLRTAADGTFTMSDLPSSEFHVSLKADGFDRMETTLNGSPGALLSWNPVLSSGLSIRGRLLMPGMDFSNWSVHCTSQDSHVEFFSDPSFRVTVRPDAEGSFEISGCRDVGHTIAVHPPDSFRAIFPAAQLKDVHPGESVLTITINRDSLPTCKLRGRIVDDKGQPVPGIEYMVAREGSNGAPVLSADAQGTFDIGPLPPGKYGIGVHAAGFAPFMSPLVDVAPGATWDFGDLRLQRGGTIAVHLTRDDAHAKSEVEIYAQQPGSGTSYTLPILGEVAHSQVLTPGEYIVELIGHESDEIAQRSVRVNVRSGEEIRIELPVDAGARIQVAIAPPGNDKAMIQALDAAGTVLWEGQAWQTRSIVLPLEAVRLVARDDNAHSAELSFVSLASLRGKLVTLELK